MIQDYFLSSIDLLVTHSAVCQFHASVNQNSRIWSVQKSVTYHNMINYQLTGVLRPSQIAHLWSSVNTLQRPTSYGVPEPDSSVCRPTSTSQETVLMGWPCYRLDRGKVLGIRLYRTNAACVPDKQLVVITSWCQVLMVRRPLQATHLTDNIQLDDSRYGAEQ